MSAAEILNLPFVQIALPIMFTMVLAVIVQNKRFDDINKRLDEIIVRLGSIDAKLENHNERITRLEERTSPLSRR